MKGCKTQELTAAVVKQLTKCGVKSRNKILISKADSDNHIESVHSLLRRFAEQRSDYLCRTEGF